MTRALATAALLAMALTLPAAAQQQKPTVSGFMAQGFDIVRADIGGQFLMFILRKDKELVFCTVALPSGDTSTCRTIK
jgi:hypothetical protein